MARDTHGRPGSLVPSERAGGLLGPAGPVIEAVKVILTKSPADGVLSQEACRDRLSRSRRGFLACTQRALPSVVPAELEVRQGRLLVSVRDVVLRRQLPGQVVALSVGRRSSRLRGGWTVIARGRLGPAEPPAGSSLQLEVAQLEGITYVSQP